MEFKAAFLHLIVNSILLGTFTIVRGRGSRVFFIRWKRNLHLFPGLVDMSLEYRGLDPGSWILAENVLKTEIKSVIECVG
jgi:hypothetical protein